MTNNLDFSNWQTGVQSLGQAMLDSAGQVLGQSGQQGSANLSNFSGNSGTNLAQSLQSISNNVSMPTGLSVNNNTVGSVGDNNMFSESEQEKRKKILETLAKSLGNILV